MKASTSSSSFSDNDGRRGDDPPIRRPFSSDNDGRRGDDPPIRRPFVSDNDGRRGEDPPSRRPFSNGRGGPVRNEEDEEDDARKQFFADDEYDEEEALRKQFFSDEEETATTPKPKPTSKPIVCTTGASNELYANPRSCR